MHPKYLVITSCNCAREQYNYACKFLTTIDLLRKKWNLSSNSMSLYALLLRYCSTFACFTNGSCIRVCIAIHSVIRKKRSTSNLDDPVPITSSGRQIIIWSDQSSWCKLCKKHLTLFCLLSHLEELGDFPFIRLAPEPRAPAWTEPNVWNSLYVWRHGHAEQKIYDSIIWHNSTQTAGTLQNRIP